MSKLATYVGLKWYITLF